MGPEVLRELEQARPRDALVNGVSAVEAGSSVAGLAEKIVVESRVGQHVTEDLFNMPPVPMMDED